MLKDVQQGKVIRSTIGIQQEIKRLATKIYDKDEIEDFRMDEAIKNNPLQHKSTNTRSRLAYQEIINNLNPTKKYMLPGQVCCFYYDEPKYKDELEYYDKTPLTVFIGLIRTKDNTIREVGVNLHYFPPFMRARVLNTLYELFKDHFQKCFNEPSNKPYKFISWKSLKGVFKRNAKIAFATKMYIPVLRGTTYIIPTRMLPIANFTEGHFAKKTLIQIQHFWRQFRP